MQVTADIEGYRCLCNTGLVSSPLIGHVSFLLDIDVARINDVPQSETELWTMIANMRVLKNQLFESSITQRARDLFE